MSMASLYDVNNSQVSVLTKSIGLHGQWGMSTVFDFLEVYEKLMKSKPHRSPETKVEEVNESPNRLNILLMNPGDLRHILCALAKKRRHSFRKEKEENFPEIHFYLLEQNCELMARHLVLLSVFLNFEIPIRQRANTFFEIYGNLKVQRRTKVLIDSLSKELLNLISSQNSQNAFPSIASVSSQLSLLRQLVNFDMFHYRDFDLLSSALKNYQTSFVYKIDEFFNTRQRGLYEDRYDSRQALYDWDYHQNYKKTATIIHIKTYKHWRETGIGYEFGDQVYNEPNPTFISYTEGIMKKGAKRGEKQEVLGYWGDIVGGPFVSFGINSDSNGCKFAEELYEILNKVKAILIAPFCF
jgi:dynein assembly factor 3